MSRISWPLIGEEALIFTLDAVLVRLNGQTPIPPIETHSYILRNAIRSGINIFVLFAFAALSILFIICLVRAIQHWDKTRGLHLLLSGLGILLVLGLWAATNFVFSCFGCY